MAKDCKPIILTCLNQRSDYINDHMDAINDIVIAKGEDASVVTLFHDRNFELGKAAHH